MNIDQEIKQKKFKSSIQKAVINTLFTGSWLTGRQAGELKEFGITPQQYNILRILRGSYPDPLTIKILTERMIDRTSNASRLVEKLVRKELVTRTVCPNDRRAVDVVINRRGLFLLKEIDEKRTFLNHIQNNLTQEEAEQLSRLLDKMRYGS